MKLKMIQILERGVAQKERVHLSVLADADLGYYAILDTVRLTTGNIVAGSRRVYWFATKKVRAGDFVVLYTGTGTSVTNARADGKNNHFFYWGLKETVWGNALSAAVLLEIGSWETSAI